jgi:hypothetical protein
MLTDAEPEEDNAKLYALLRALATWQSTLPQFLKHEGWTVADATKQITTWAELNQLCGRRRQ